MFMKEDLYFHPDKIKEIIPEISDSSIDFFKYSMLRRDSSHPAWQEFMELAHKKFPEFFI